MKKQMCKGFVILVKGDEMIDNETCKNSKVTALNSVLGARCFNESPKVALKVHSKNTILL